MIQSYFLIRKKNPVLYRVKDIPGTKSTYVPHYALILKRAILSHSF